MNEKAQEYAVLWLITCGSAPMEMREIQKRLREAGHQWWPIFRLLRGQEYIIPYGAKGDTSVRYQLSEYGLQAIRK